MKNQKTKLNANNFLASFLVTGLLGLISSWAQAGTEVSAHDDAGNTITLSAPAKRVITLAPSLTELLYVAGGGHTLVGTVHYSNYPPEAQKVARIGDGVQLDLERIALLKPDLIVAWQSGNSARSLKLLKHLSVPIFYLETKKITDMPDAIRRLGLLTGSTSTAEAAAQKYLSRYQSLHKRYANATKIRVFYQIASQPLITISNDHIISDVLTLCGGENIFGQQTVMVPQISIESVVAANPQVIMTARLNRSDQIDPSRNPDDPAFLSWKSFTSVPAVHDKQFWTIPADLISRSGPRILDGAQAICEALDSARNP